MGMPYEGGDIVAALLSSSRTWDFRYERLYLDGTSVGPMTLSNVKVSHNALADKIKRTCTASIRADSGFDFLSDRMRIFARLKMFDGDWQEWPLGTFLLTTSQQARGAAMPREARPVTGYDLLQVLVEDSMLDRYVVDTATNYVTAVNAVLVSAGFPTSQITPTSMTLPAPLEWEPSTSKIKIVNDLLAAINYTPLSMTPLGVPISAPYVEPSAADVLWSYTLNTASLVQPGTLVELDLFNVPNRIVGVVSEPDRPPLVAVATNSAPTSPLSTVRRGRTISSTLTQTIQQAPDLVTLQAIVDRTLAATAQQYERIEFDTGLMPIHNDGDVVLFDDGSGALRYRETSWDMELKPGGTMKHSARRTVILG